MASGDGVERARPDIPIEREDERGVAHHLRQRGPIAAHDGRARRHRLEHGRAEALVLRRVHERVGRGDEPVPVAVGHPAGPDHPALEATSGDVRGDVVLGEAAPAEEDQCQPGVVPRPGHQVEQEAVVLVGMGDRRVDDEAAVAEPVAVAQRRRVGDTVGRRRVEAVGHDDHCVRIDPERLDHGRPDVLAGHRHDRGAAHRPRHRDLEIAAFDGREVRRKGSVLQIVHGEHDRVR